MFVSDMQLAYAIHWGPMIIFLKKKKKIIYPLGASQTEFWLDS